MFMFPAMYGPRVITDFVSAFKDALDRNYFPMERLDQALVRIMAVKISMGLVQKPHLERLTK